MMRRLRGTGETPPWREFTVLTGRTTFSAAVRGLAVILDSFDATIIGEPLGAEMRAVPVVAARGVSTAHRLQAGR